MKARLTLIALAASIAACGTESKIQRVVGETASDRIELTAEFHEPIVAVTFEEGDSVSTGQVLIRQDDTRARARLAEANAARLQARARLDELIRGPRQEQINAARANVEGATQELDFRRSEQKRIAALHERGLSSTDALDKAGAALDAAEANNKLRHAQLSELLAGTTIEELAQAEQAVAQAEARYDAVAVDVARHSITAPVDGIVDSRIFELGEKPNPGQAVVILLGGRQPYARVFIPEQLRVQISAGTAAKILVDGLASPVAGRVRWVSSDAAFTPYYALTERDRSRLTFVAKIDVTDDIERLPDGIPVEVEFLLN